jgi:hypothetical protein
MKCLSLTTKDRSASDALLGSFDLILRDAISVFAGPEVFEQVDLVAVGTWSCQVFMRSVFFFKSGFYLDISIARHDSVGHWKFRFSFCCSIELGNDAQPCVYRVTGIG